MNDSVNGNKEVGKTLEGVTLRGPDIHGQNGVWACYTLIVGHNGGD